MTYCLDLLDSGSLKLLKASYDTLIKTLKAAGEEMPASSLWVERSETREFIALSLLGFTAFDPGYTLWITLNSPPP